jgi:hypothetical protein
LNGLPPFCVEIKAGRPDGRPIIYNTNGTKQWGAACLASKGIENDDCDTAQGFACYGTSPTDAKSYCTRYDCTKDTECGPGFWCAKINVTPNVGTARRATIGDVQTVCLRRDYCATCTADLDCPDLEGAHHHCIPDDSGVSFCTPECTGAANCHNEANCADVGIGPKICYPRAGVCLGDGSLCSPCRVDTDCGDDGACVKGDYTTEKACAKKVTACTACPKTIKTPARTIGCSKDASATIPANYCVGLYSKAGTLSDIGCWTPNN